MMSSKLIIKTHRPWHFRLRVILVVCLLVLTGWGLVEYGRSQAEVAGQSLSEELKTLQAELASARDLNEQLSERMAVLERASQVDTEAYSEVEKSLKRAQDEKLELKEEVAFYRSIFLPKETSSGLNIAEFKLKGIGEERAYRFKLVLTQMNANDVVVKGYTTIAIEGVQGGNQVQLDLQSVSGGKVDKLKFGFRYFQNNEGEIVLPDGFLPSRVLVNVTPTSKGFSQLKKTFDWSDIIK